MSVEHITVPGFKNFPDIYSHGAKAPGLIFVSGQTALDPNGEKVPGGIEEHTEYVIGKVEAVLKAAGSDLSKLVKVNIYLLDMANFAAMNKVYERLIPSPKPARTCIQAAKLPRGAIIEIEAIAAP